jgi:hypothetical protein
LGLLDDNEYDYVPQHMLWPSPPHHQKEEVEVLVDMPTGLSEEEAIQMAIQDSHLVELFQWEGLGLQLHASAPAQPAG